jgi:heme/copper-type cytochrome/quinol oxidase subunit 2
MEHEMIRIPISLVAGLLINITLYVIFCLVSLLLIAVFGDYKHKDTESPIDILKKDRLLSVVWIITCIIIFTLMFTNLIVFI